MSGAATCPHGRQLTICAECAPMLEQQLLKARELLGDAAGTAAHQKQLEARVRVIRCHCPPGAWPCEC